MLNAVTSFAITETLGTIGSYIVAGVMVGAGVYLAGFATVSEANPLYPFIKPLRYVGLGLAVAGILLGSAAYFKHVGAAECEAAWKAKNLELQIVNLARDLAAQKKAAEVKADEAKLLQEQKATADEQVTQWQDYTRTLSASLLACRGASADDDRRVCDIIGNAAAGCKPAR